MLDGRFDPGFDHLFRSATDERPHRARLLIAVFLGALPFALLALFASLA